MKEYLFKLLVWFDNGVNVALGPLLNVLLRTNRFGFNDETLSSVFGKEVRGGQCKFCFYVCRVLYFLDKNHCKKSIEDDEGLK